MDPKLLMRKKDELLAKRQALLEKMIAEGRNVYTDEERATEEQLKAEIAGLDELITNALEIEDQRAGIPPNQAAVGQQQQDPNQDRADDKEWPGGFGEFLQMVARAADPSLSVDSRLIRSTEERQLGMSEGVPSAGGFLVKTDFVEQLLIRTYELAILGSLAWKVPISATANGLTLKAIAESSRATGSRWGQVQAYWAGEGKVKTASELKFREMELKLKKLIGLCYSTDELLEDAPALAAIITRAFTEEFAFMVDDAIYRGSGVGSPLGIINSPSLVTVAKEAGQPAATILFENIVKMWSRLWGRSRPNARWFINQDIEPQLFGMSLAVGVGGIPVYLPANGLSAQPYGTLMSRPVITIEHADTLGQVGDIMLADISQYLLIDKGAMKAATSIHVKFLYDETAFRFVYRVDGQPLWNLPLSPFRGTSTQSPFVVLAARE